MSYVLNRKIADLTPYEPLSGSYRVRLDANESCFDLPDAILDEIGASVKETAFRRYPDPKAAGLCEAFGEYYGIPSSLVTAGNGSDELISVIVTAFSLKGEPCYTFTEDFSMYRFYGELSECERVVLPKREDLTIDTDEVISRVGDRGLLLFSNPCNPTSLGIGRDEVRKLIRSVKCLVVLDEAYMDFWDQSLLGEVDRYDNLIILRTCSKAFGLAGIRLGFAAANQTVTKALRAVKSPYNVNAVTQAVGSIVLKNRDYLRGRTEALIEERKELEKALTSLSVRFPVLEKVYPSVTNFVLVRTKKAERIAAGLRERSVSVRLFDGYLRITAGTREEHELLISALEEVLREVSE